MPTQVEPNMIYSSIDYSYTGHKIPVFTLSQFQNASELMALGVQICSYVGDEQYVSDLALAENINIIR